MLALLIGVGSSGCVPPSGAAPADEADAGAELCTGPFEGCLCDPGAAAISCWMDPQYADDGSLLCETGTMACVGGRWGGCVGNGGAQPHPAGVASAALITGPDVCNPCNPLCFVSRDTPTCSPPPGTCDLTPGNSTDVSYDPGRPGITIDPDPPVTPPLTDSDGDGVPDVADECPGPGAFLAADGSCYGSLFFYHTLPYGGAAAVDALPISVQVRTADIYFLMDTTGSMGGELTRLRTDLTSGSFRPGCSGGIIGAIRCTIPDAWFGVGSFDDYPVSPYGGAAYGDVVYSNRLDIQSSISAAQTAVNGLSIHWGNDGPESNTQALYAVASGNGLGAFLPSRTCTGGRWGYPCFRAGTIPIVVHITDAMFHEGPGNAFPYSGITGRVTWATTIAALVARSVRVITVQSCGGEAWCNGSAPAHASSLAYATSSTGSSGSPYVFPISSNGTGLSGAIVDAIVDLANYNRMDVTARASGDTQGFTRSIVARSWGPGSCTGISGGTTFLGCLPGTSVNFDVTFQNTTVMPTMVPQIFSFFIEVVGNGTFVLARVPVRIVVPPQVALYPPEGRYVRTHDGQASCGSMGTLAPYWNRLEWTADIPTGTSVRFELRTAQTAAALDAATPVIINVTNSGSMARMLDPLFTAISVANGQRFLRVTTVLLSNPPRTLSPAVSRVELRYDCITDT